MDAQLNPGEMPEPMQVSAVRKSAKRPKGGFKPRMTQQQAEAELQTQHRQLPHPHLTATKTLFV